MKVLYVPSQESMIYYNSIAIALGIQYTADPRAYHVPIPKTIGWHPLMNHYIPVRRGYNNKGFTIGSQSQYKDVEVYAKPSEEKLRFYALKHQFYVMSEFDVLTLTKMLMWKVPVVLNLTGDPEIDTFYEPLTLRTPPQHGQARLIGDKFLMLFKQTTLIIPNVTDTLNQEIDIITPDDLNEPIVDADVTITDKNVALRLSRTEDINTMPQVTLLITDVSQPILLENNINNTTYPHHLLNIVTVNCTYCNYPSIILQNVDITSIMNALPGIVVIMSSLYWYYPHSIYAKVKLLLDYNDKTIVGTHTIPFYHLTLDPHSYIRETDIPPLETVAFHNNTKTTICISRSCYLNMPFNFNCINVSPHEPIDKFTPTNNIFTLIDFSTQHVINKVYRSLYGRPTI